MSMYLNAVVMLVAVLAAFILIAKGLQALRTRGLSATAWRGPRLASASPSARLAIEQACMVDAKRRLVLVRCEGQRVLLLTGGPSDLVVSVLPQENAA